MTLRAMGPFNGILPEPTDILVAFMRDPKRMPYLKYAQLISAPEIAFKYAKLDPDEVARLVDLNEYAWAYDDYRPTGKGQTVRIEWIDDSVQRWDFPYTIGDTTIRTWKKAGIQARQVFDQIKSSQAALHRAVRVVNALTGASWGANTATLNSLLGTTGAYFDLSSGTQFDPATGGTVPNFQVIKRAFQAVKRRIHLATNAALTGQELVAVLPVKVAQAMAVSGEMFEALKQSRYAKELTDPIIEDWNLPATYGGFSLVVEDTPRVYINQKASGVIADVTIPSERNYIYDDNSITFVSRPGKLDGEFGSPNFSTVQVFHYNGEARVEAFTEPKHELVDAHVVMEDKVLTPALVSGFRLTGVLSPAAD